MIARLFRFHGYNALTAVYKRGTTVRGPLMSVKYAIGKPGRYRAAVVVSKKVHKSAVVRNRIRRRLFELIRTQQTQLDGIDLVLTVFNDQVATMSASQLQQQVTELLGKLNRATPVSELSEHGIVNGKRKL